MSDNFNKDRILKNTLFLYVRMLLTIWINLYATRLVLQNLGVENMGVYGVVGSIVSIFSVFTGGITNAVQRFIIFETGLKEGNVNRVFCSSLNILFIFAGVLLIVLESIGLWFLYNKINIPEASKDAAFWVFQFSILTCLINLISIPYNALIIAREKMNAFAFISIIQVILNCLAAYFILYLDNKLLWYALFMLLASFIIRFTYQIYCQIHFPESKYHRNIDKKLLKEIGKYTGASTTSGILQMISGQGLTLVINWTFGVTLNAVYNIALQLKNSILSFALNLHKATAPQITKTYANGEIDTYKKLTYSSSKMEIYLIYFIMIPFLLRTKYIMQLWLGPSLPPYAVEFTQCTVFVSLTYAAFVPISTAVLTTTQITKFLILPEITYLLVLPCTYFSYYITHDPIVLIVCIVGIDLINVGFRIFLAAKVSPLEIKGMIMNIFLPSVIVAILTSLFSWLINPILPNNIVGLLALIISNSLFLLFVIYILGLNQIEKNALHKLYIKLKNKYKEK